MLPNEPISHQPPPLRVRIMSPTRWILAALVFSLAVWGGLTAWRIHRQLKLVEMIEDVNGRLGGEAGAPKWLQKVLGETLNRGMARINEIETQPETKRGLTDADLTEIAQVCPDIVSLTVWRSEVTDRGLMALAESTSLKRFNLESPHVSDVGIRTLSGLTELRELTLLSRISHQVKQTNCPPGA